ncbi:AAA family ATPase [Streptosporangium sp. NPDC049248]|uniref:AAA family ATPase n=1 Tax=Streptosporangium sp. NPDC049248 TaxID=3155651 RepID=UPI00342194C6
MNYDFKSLSVVPFKALEIKLSNRKKIRIDKSAATDDGVIFDLSGNDAYGRSYNAYSLNYSELSEEEGKPAWLHQTPDGTWFDARNSKVVSADFVRRRYGITGEMVTYKFPKEYFWINNFFSGTSAILIDTKRLDSTPPLREVYSTEDPFRRLGEPVSSRINRYMEQVRVQITDARRASLGESQIADQSFAVRVLEKARTTVKEKELKERYQRIAEQQAELYSNGLSARLVDVQFPNSRTNPTERRILSVFLDDWEKKLKPLLPVNEKIKTLRQIVNNKFKDKELIIDQKGGIGFTSIPNDQPLRVKLLSSGEQHLLAVFTLLLFSADSGSLVLIDEPEISMHAAWKHAFLNDIAQVAEINDLQIVLATHSSGIINGRWELVQEIGVAE